MAFIRTVSGILCVIWSACALYAIEARSTFFSRLSEFDNQVPFSSSMDILRDVSKSRCAAACAESILCRIFFYNTHFHVCRLHGIFYYKGTILVFEKHSLSFQKGCTVDCFTSHYGMCFRLFEENLRYTAAKSECDKYNSTLLILDTNDKFKLILEYLMENEKTGGYFIGLSDRKTEGIWLWENSKPVDMTFFFTSQPNDFDGYPGYTNLGADCGTIIWRLGGIGDNCCDRPPFVKKFTISKTLFTIN